MSFVFTLKDIIGMSICVSISSKERKNGALKVVDAANLIVWYINTIHHHY